MNFLTESDRCENIRDSSHGLVLYMCAQYWRNSLTATGAKDLRIKFNAPRIVGRLYKLTIDYD